MGKIYVKYVMAIAVLLMTVVNVSAADFTPYAPEELDKAVVDIQNKCNEAMALASNLMTKEKKDQLKKAIIAGTAAWDTNKPDINVINAAFPLLIDAMADAEQSVTECKALSEKVQAYINEEQEANDAAAEKYEGNATLKAALDELYEKYDGVRGFFNDSENITDEIVQVFLRGESMDKVFAVAGIDLPTVEETIRTLGIHSVEAANAGSAAEYSLSGAKVQTNYKGLVIKKGKKVIKR